jgi:hypothetical protein
MFLISIKSNFIVYRGMKKQNFLIILSFIIIQSINFLIKNFRNLKKIFLLFDIFFK